MSRLIVAVVLSAFGIAAASAATPIGEWLVKDKTAHIRIVSCGNGLWGVLSWAKTPGKDENNPDPAKRNRPLLGVPILRHMKPSASNPGRWDGEVYNAEDGNIYTSHISLASNDVLKIEGCALFGMICGGENWTRLPSADQKTDAPSNEVCERVTSLQ
jgi:uncharacterized protein (DUF2147 family)